MNRRTVEHVKEESEIGGLRIKTPNDGGITISEDLRRSLINNEHMVNVNMNIHRKLLYH